MTDAPRSVAQILAARLGVGETQAKEIIRQHGGLPPVAEELDAQLKAEAALADLEAARSIDDMDLLDVSLSDDPQSALNETLATRSERAMRASLAANERWSREDPRPHAAKMRAAFDERFAKQIDAEFPHLDPQERQRRIAARRKAYFTRLALKSAQVRRKKREG